MGSAALFSGLETGFGLLGKSVLDDQKRAADEASEERKMKLKAKIEMDLMAAKFQFMRQNPQYKHFATDLSGNIIGFDQYGSPKVLHEASPEEKQIKLDTARANAAVKTSSQIKDEAQAGEAGARTLSITDRMNNPQKYFKPTAAKTTKAAADPFIVTPEHKEKIIKSYMPPLIVANTMPGNASYEKARSAAEKRFTDEGYSVGRQANQPGGLAAPPDAQPDSGVFSGLIPQDGTVSDDDEPDESDASPMLMEEDEENR